MDDHRASWRTDKHANNRAIDDAVIPDIPVALAVTCGMAAVPGAAVAIPFTLIAIIGFAVTLNASNIGPIGLAVLTSYLIVEGLGLAGRAQSADAPPVDADAPAAEEPTTPPHASKRA